MYNTGNPVPSTALEDMADNAQTFDALVTKTEGTATDRFGRTRRVFQQILMDMGFQPLAGTFQTGETVTARNQALYDEVSQVFYAWGGVIPVGGYVVPVGSTPATAGGVGVGAWSDKTDLMLRSELESDGQTISDIAGDSTKHKAGRVTYASLPRLMKSFVDYNDATDIEIKILGLGSSVGNGATLHDSVNQCPVGYLTAQLNAKMNKLGNKTITAYNRSVDGSNVITGITSLINALAEPIVPKLVVVAYGMNDGATASYNAGQAYSNVYAHTKEIIRRAKDAGSDVVILTTPHPHLDRAGFSMPAGVAQVYPTVISSPVADEALIPPVSQSKPVIDAAGDGFMMPVSYRHMRVNEAMRKAAADTGVPVIDTEWYWFKAVEKYGQDALYDAGEQVHPNLVGHQQSYWRAIDDFIDSLSASSVMGHQQNDYSDRLSVGTDTPSAQSHIKQVDESKAIQKVEAINGHGIMVNSNGDVKPLETIDSAWEFPRTIVKTLVYPGSSPVGKCREILGLNFNVSDPLSLHTTVAESLTELTVKSTNTGIGSGWQAAKYVINNKAGVLTINVLYSYGDTIANLSASGADVVITPVAANTNFTYEIKDIYLTT